MAIRYTLTIILSIILLVPAVFSCSTPPKPDVSPVQPGDNKDNEKLPNPLNQSVPVVPNETKSTRNVLINGLESSDDLIEGDTATITAIISNRGGSPIADYTNSIYVDTKLLSTSNIKLDTGINRINYAFKENSACIRYVETGGQGVIVVFHPAGNPDSINRTSFTDYYNTESDVIWAPGKYVNIKSNFDAKNPTYSQLINFLGAKDYSSDRYAAETMHNDAEARGIKCAFVWWEAENAETKTVGDLSILTQYVSNADLLVAFKTIDKGLAFAHPKLPGHIIYLEKRKPVGIIDLQNALFSDYNYFEKYASMVDSETNRLKKLLPDVTLDLPKYTKDARTTGKCKMWW